MINRILISPLIPELYCSNIKNSLAFYMGILGFEMMYQREEEGFAMLEREGARIMLCEIKKGTRLWLADRLETPYGRGVNFQIKTSQIAVLYEKIQQNHVAIFFPMEEKWYRVGDVKLYQLQFIILDPDGYMLRFVEFVDEPQSSLTDQIQTNANA